MGYCIMVSQSKPAEHDHRKQSTGYSQCMVASAWVGGVASWCVSVCVCVRVRAYEIMQLYMDVCEFVILRLCLEVCECVILPLLVSLGSVCVFVCICLCEF